MLAIGDGDITCMKNYLAFIPIRNEAAYHLLDVETFQVVKKAKWPERFTRKRMINHVTSKICKREHHRLRSQPPSEFNFDD